MLSPEMNIKERYLYEINSQAEIARWCAGLRWFRFCRAYGGHANDGDSFQAAIKFSSESELLRIMQLLGIELNILPSDNPIPVPGKSYSWEEFEKFKFCIKEYPRYEQPGWQRILGFSAFVNIKAHHIHIHLSGAEGNVFLVTERDFENARAVENHLEPYELKFSHPTKECFCICEECYPAVLGKD